jgi:uncharacterized protein YwqG
MNRELDGSRYDALAERLRANGLARVVDTVLRLARPAIRLDLTRVEDEAALPLGASKVGGEPDLPIGASWPTTGEGDPLPFIAQIRLAEIAQYDPEGDLPHTGLLSFFYAMNDPEGSLRIADDPSAWRVLWSRDESAPLARLATPDALTDALDSSFPACGISYARRLTLPDSEAYVVRQIGFTNNERLGYIAVTGGSDVAYLPEMDHRLLGYPYALEPFTFTDAYRAAHSIERPESALHQGGEEARRRAMERLQELAQQWRPPAAGYNSPEDVINAINDLPSRVDMHDLMRTLDIAQPKPTPAALEAQRQRQELDRQAEEEWRLLLQVYSNDEAQMDWAGGGVIHFGIQRDDLATHTFSRVWVSLQFL